MINNFFHPFFQHKAENEHKHGHWHDHKHGHKHGHKVRIIILKQNFKIRILTFEICSHSTSTGMIISTTTSTSTNTGRIMSINTSTNTSIRTNGVATAMAVKNSLDISDDFRRIWISRLSLRDAYPPEKVLLNLQDQLDDWSKLTITHLNSMKIGILIMNFILLSSVSN